MSFDTLGLDARLLRAVSSMGYTSPTPIQNEAIPLVLAGRDVVGCAQTGTGKTAAFVLPLMQQIPARKGGIRALVVTPTRELAVQIQDVAIQVAKQTGHRVTVAYGGVGYEPQKKALRRGVDILVACPGRLLDLIAQGDCNLGSVDVLVLDEADRMLDMGFWPDVKRIIAKVPANRQNLLFSATMSPEVLKIINATLDNPAHVSVTPQATPVEAIEQSLYPVGAKQKTDLLISMVQEQGLKRVLVFTRTKHRADRVAKVLDRAGIRGAAIHGNRSQAQRQKALESFRKGHVHVLVATDVVSRGIDIDDITHVVNYDMPGSGADYVHRIGRTARAGRTGTAISMYSPEENENLRDIERALGSTLECEDHPGFSYTDERHVPDPARSATNPTPKSGNKPKAKGRSGGRSGSSRAGASGASSGGGRGGTGQSQRSGGSQGGGSAQGQRGGGSDQPKDAGARRGGSQTTGSHGGNASRGGQGGSGSRGRSTTGGQPAVESTGGGGQRTRRRRRPPNV